MTKQWHFRAAPYGDSTGILHCAVDGLQLRLVVVPKIWSSATGPVRMDWPEGLDEITVTLAETQAVTIACSTAPQELLLKKLVETLHVRPDLRKLLVVSHAVEASEPCGDLDSGLERALVRLALRYGVLSLDTSSSGPYRDGAGSTADRIILAQSLASTAEELLPHSRPDYVTVEARLGGVKGRPRPLDLALARKGISPYIRCTYSQLASDTPMATLGASALQRARDWIAATPASASMRDLMSQLQRVLSIWPGASAPSHVALSLVAPATRSARNELEGQLVRLSEMVLGDRSSFRPETQGPFRWFEARVEMARLWELLVMDHLRHTGYPDVIDGNRAAGRLRLKAPPPWSIPGGASRLPDLAFPSADGWRLGDAKYKWLAGAPDPSDVNQMFMYSQLVTVDGVRPQRMDLIYPTPGAASEQGPFAGTADDVPPLMLRFFPFPMPTELGD